MLKKFREEWKAAGEALDRNAARRAKTKAKAAPVRQDDAAAVTAANTATIAGNVANTIVNQ